MLVTKEKLLNLVKANGDKGIITINDIPYEIELTEEGNVSLTGFSWSWEKTEVPSAHQDYDIKTDDLVKNNVDDLPSLNNVNHYNYYNNVNELMI
ncbi:hypothetical protein [Litchfieldia salsa]|uniref:Uncharacterized protein n=1 Tax=Litchfieldia salsa TaxID=930152 RepID=A0A1H0RP10_9BACI|nr:hypothetical protein [Litchfieldia salsa]SDP31203.1 hypothetical protein SAMN05216565_102315 [Litchfieldia salsa]